MAIRSWYVGQALASVSKLNNVLSELTEEEILACLDLESQSSRRKSIVDRLISRAARLNELWYVSTLNEKYRASRTQTEN
ncbi:hypothetical protein [Herminiimonas sp. CN]|uniref:hypothetical protein n=1 Tax=Herminiimonas sp. CN TaxID=1349818 RepID=UPI0004735E71|nr:hypothetical protein [Herminiimonas sp. CN]